VIVREEEKKDNKKGRERKMDLDFFLLI